MNAFFIEISVFIGKIIGEIRHAFGVKNAVRIKPYYNIKIADGCLSSCAYCATRFATGALRSRPLGDIVNDFARGVRRGYHYFQLISEDTGCYGLDIESSITDLLERLFAFEGAYKIILIDFNPSWLITQQDRLIPLLARHQEKMKEIFIPFQSGADRVLNRMQREYRSDEFIAAIQRLRREAPAIAIRTCVIVGFPGESEDDFEATKRMIRAIDFAEVTVNRYEDRPRTPASSCADKIAHDVIENRAQALVRELECKLLS